MSVYGDTGGNVEICLPKAAEDCRQHPLYRITGGLGQLQINTSETIYTLSDRAVYVNFDWPMVFIQNLSSSDGGLYKVESWCDSKLVTSHNFWITVCRTRIPQKQVEYNGVTYKLVLPAFDPSQGDTLEIYKIRITHPNQRSCYVAATQIFPKHSHNRMKVVLTDSTLQFPYVWPNRSRTIPEHHKERGRVPDYAGVLSFILFTLRTGASPISRGRTTTTLRPVWGESEPLLSYGTWIQREGEMENSR